MKKKSDDDVDIFLEFWIVDCQTLHIKNPENWDRIILRVWCRYMDGVYIFEEINRSHISEYLNRKCNFLIVHSNRQKLDLSFFFVFLFPDSDYHREFAATAAVALFLFTLSEFLKNAAHIYGLPHCVNSQNGIMDTLFRLDLMKNARERYIIENARSLICTMVFWHHPQFHICGSFRHVNHFSLLWNFSLLHFPSSLGVYAFFRFSILSFFVCKNAVSVHNSGDEIRLIHRKW